MKSCELCMSAARVFCDSDQASLCWDCDSKVHSANFLVAKHSRNLLCHVCQSPTAWNASGSKLGKTVSVCEACVDGCDRVKKCTHRIGDSEEGHGRDVDTETDVSDENDSESDGEEEEAAEVKGDDEDADNQVVPWSSTSPSAASSSSDDEFFHATVDLGAVEIGRESTSPAATGGSEADFVDSARPLKCRKITSVVDSIKRFHGQGLTSGNQATATIAEICKLSKVPATGWW